MPFGAPFCTDPLFSWLVLNPQNSFMYCMAAERAIAGPWNQRRPVEKCGEWWNSPANPSGHKEKPKDFCSGEDGQNGNIHALSYFCLSLSLDNLQIAQSLSLFSVWALSNLACPRKISIAVWSNASAKAVGIQALSWTLGHGDSKWEGRWLVATNWTQPLCHSLVLVEISSSSNTKLGVSYIILINKFGHKSEKHRQNQQHWQWKLNCSSLWNSSALLDVKVISGLLVLHLLGLLCIHFCHTSAMDHPVVVPSGRSSGMRQNMI